VSNSAWRASKGKRTRLEVQAFYACHERSIASVVNALRNGRMPSGKFRQFTIFDPKQRTITAAAFIDRVAHHALVAPIHDPLDSWLSHTSFACRRGKGVHAAALYAQRQCRRFDVYLKMDVRNYFEQVNHALLLSLLQKRLAGDELFTLISSVLEGYCAAPGRGLPIGALTSQQFANVYLNPADQWLIHQPQVRAHCRYMDDTVIWFDSAGAARAVFKAYSDWLLSTCRLELKPALIQKCRFGLSFCGYRIFPHHLRPGRRRLRRCEQHLRYWQRQYTEGNIDINRLQQNTDSAYAILQPGKCRHWQRYALKPGAGAWCAAARGTTTAGTCVPPCVTTTPLTTATTILASAWSQLAADCQQATKSRGPAYRPVLCLFAGKSKRAGT